MGLVSLVLVVRALKRKASSAVVSQFRKLFTTGRNWWDNRKIGNLDDASKKTKPNAETSNQNAEKKQTDATKKQTDAKEEQPGNKDKQPDAETPKPTAETPKPTAETSKPNDEILKPPAGTLKPPAGTLKPPAGTLKPITIDFYIDGKQVHIPFDNVSHFNELRAQLASGTILNDDLITKMKPIFAEARW